MNSLDSILDGETVEQPEETGAEVETAEEPKGEEVTSEPPAPETEERMVPQAALLDERRKRQELEQQLNSKPKQAPDVFEDQEGFTNHVTQLVNQQVLNDRANMSEFLARRDYPDLDSKVEKFQEMAQSNPALQQQVLNAVSPYHELYDIVTKADQLAEMQNVDAYKAKLRAEVEAELKAEYEQKQSAEQKLRESIPPSLNDVGSKGSLKGHDWAGPTSLDSILS